MSEKWIGSGIGIELLPDGTLEVKVNRIVTSTSLDEHSNWTIRANPAQAVSLSDKLYGIRDPAGLLADARKLVKRLQEMHQSTTTFLLTKQLASHLTEEP